MAGSKFSLKGVKFLPDATDFVNQWVENSHEGQDPNKFGRSSKVKREEVRYKGKKRVIPLRTTPPKPEDPNYPLYTFLETRFPNGGIFRTRPDEQMPGSTEDLQHFCAWLKTPEYADHLFSRTYLAGLERPNNGSNISVLFKNIETLRRATRQKVVSKRENGKRVETVLWIAAPGDPAPDPFVENPYAPHAASNSSTVRKRTKTVTLDPDYEFGVRPKPKVSSKLNYDAIAKALAEENEELPAIKCTRKRAASSTEETVDHRPRKKARGLSTQDVTAVQKTPSVSCNSDFVAANEMVAVQENDENEEEEEGTDFIYYGC